MLSGLRCAWPWRFAISFALSPSRSPPPNFCFLFLFFFDCLPTPLFFFLFCFLFFFPLLAPPLSVPFLCFLALGALGLGALRFLLPSPPLVPPPFFSVFCFPYISLASPLYFFSSLRFVAFPSFWGGGCSPVPVPCTARSPCGVVCPAVSFGGVCFLIVACLAFVVVVPPPRRRLGGFRLRFVCFLFGGGGGGGCCPALCEVPCLLALRCCVTCCFS